MLNGMPALETTEFLLSKIDEFGTPERLQPLRGGLGARDGHAISVDQAGGLALGRHPQRHHRALAQRLHGQGRDPQRSSTTSSTSRRPSWRRPACPSRPRSTASSRRRCEGVSMAYSFDDGERARDGTRPSTSRCSATAASTTRAGRRSPGTASLGRLGATLAAFDDDVWELYDTTTTGPRRTTSAAENPEKLARTAAAVADRGGQVQRAAPRRPTHRALQLRYGRAARS